MAIYDRAIVRLLPKFRRERIRNINVAVLHVSASNAESLHNYFSTASVCSHFHVSKRGTVEQYLDTAWPSQADLEGNQRSISIETQGIAGEPWTEVQITALAKLLAWIGQVHNIPLRLAENSRTTTAGVAWHRLGIDGNFPAVGLLAGRSQLGGGEKWSAARGKICPGDERIKQIPDLIQQTRLIGQFLVTKEKEWTDMATKEELRQIFMEVLGGTDIAGAILNRDLAGKGRTEDTVWYTLKDTQNTVRALANAFTEVKAELKTAGVADDVVERAIGKALSGIKITLATENTEVA